MDRLSNYQEQEDQIVKNIFNLRVRREDMDY